MQPLNDLSPPPGCERWHFYGRTRGLVNAVSIKQWAPWQLALRSQGRMERLSLVHLSEARHLERTVLRQAVMQSLCATVRGWWHLAPEVEAEVRLACHT